LFQINVKGIALTILAIGFASVERCFFAWHIDISVETLQNYCWEENFRKEFSFDESYGVE